MMSDRARWALFVLCVPIFMVGIDLMSVGVTIAPVIKAYPSIPSLPQWVISAYAVAAALGMMVAGKVADRYGCLRTLYWGLSGFIVGALLAALSNSIGMLIAARVLQGIGSAVLVMSVITLGSTVFEERRRGHVLSRIVLATGLGVALGPLVGGLLVHHFGWRSLFLLNVPVGVLALLGIYRVMHHLHEEVKDTYVDWFSWLLAIISVVAIMTVLSMNTLISVWILSVLLVVGVLAGVAFFSRERRSTNSLLPLELFKQPSFVLANLCGLVSYLVVMGWLFMFCLFFPQVLGYTQLQLGLALLPLSLAFAYGASRVGRLIENMGYASVLVGAIGLSILGMMLLLITNQMLPYWAYACGFVLLGLGIAGLNAGSKAYAMKTIPQEISARATSMLMVVRFIGAALGVALVSSILERVSHHVFEQWRVLYHLPKTNTFNLLLEKVLAGLVSVKMLAQQHSDYMASAAIFAAKAALSSAVVVCCAVFLGLLIVMLLGFVLSMIRGRNKRMIRPVKRSRARFSANQIGLIFVACGVFFIGNFELSAISYTLPTIEASLVMPDSKIWWLLTLYTVGFATSLFVGGRSVDHFGERRVLLSGIGVFVVALLVASYSSRFVTLAICVPLQGAAMGLSWPAVQGLIITQFRGGQQRLAMALLFSLGASLGMSAGPVMSGMMSSIVTWQSLMWVMSGFSIILWVAIWMLVKNRVSVGARLISPVQTILLLLASCSFSYGLTQTQRIGFININFDLWVVLGVAMVLAAWVHRVARRDHDALSTIFKEPGFLSGLSCHLVVLYGYTMVFFMLTLYLQHERFLAPGQAGIMLLPLIAGAFVAAPWMGLLRWGSVRHWMIGGMVLFIIGLFCLVAPKPGLFDWWHLYLPLIIIGMAMGLVLPASNLLALRALKTEHVGMGSAALYFLALIAFSLSIGVSVWIARWGAQWVLYKAFLSQGITLSLAQQHNLAEAMNNMNLTAYLLKHFSTSVTDIILPRIDSVYQHAFSLAGYVAILLCVAALVVVSVARLAQTRKLRD